MRKRAPASLPGPKPVPPAPADVDSRITAALDDAGLLEPVPGAEPPELRHPELPAGLLDDTPGGDVVLHVHLDRVEIVHHAPPRRAPPPAPRRRPNPPVDHDAYLARRREDRR